MEKKVLFCNIAWMKNYVGDYDDKPFNGGGYIEKEGTGGEVYNFLDDNGKCYGYVMVKGNMALQSHYKDVKSSDEYVDDVLVVWVATNDGNSPKIIGWYKNARVYRTFQDKPSFTSSPEFNLFYNIKADAVDCCLLPVEKRTFTIDRASQAGTGMGMGQSNIWYAEGNHARTIIVPEVIKYIESFNGKGDNFVYTDRVIMEYIEEIDSKKDYTELYNEGLKYYDDEEYFYSMIYLKAAQRINNPIELQIILAQSLFLNARYDECIKSFERIIALEGETINSLMFLMGCYDRIADRKRMIDCLKRLIDLNDNSMEGIQDTIADYTVLTDIYIYENEFEMAEETINKLYDFLLNNSDYLKDDINTIINPMKDFLNKCTKNIVM